MKTPSVPQPCIRHCCLDENDVCLGCWRTLTEILEWNTYSDETKQAVLSECRLRQQARGAARHP
ncbi:DUF1289 domain-containing protein [Vibrio ostreicida]|uniref:DUF1289 domain-containing protein n=1 Tax=Vibrio ostreicida TaxID=526588 RepID=A0ABT8BZ67_9VIBR|nr:DUF1289 domain-containing protein [Vibrio ostreicida]MDN3611365.1 DUF1289 domain-containing protein [Vibrio ostreicida]NPD09301.1 DUF1289 domain-containing protein [Vibrio ostreicida]